MRSNRGLCQGGRSPMADRQSSVVMPPRIVWLRCPRCHQVSGARLPINAAWRPVLWFCSRDWAGEARVVPRRKTSDRFRSSVVPFRSPPASSSMLTTVSDSNSAYQRTRRKRFKPPLVATLHGDPPNYRNVYSDRVWMSTVLAAQGGAGQQPPSQPGRSCGPDDSRTSQAAQAGR